jgi:hypothetical protein
MIRRAALPEAMCWELLGERDKAIDAYKRAADKYATSHPDMAKEAASRASDLEQPAAADFYKWLAEYKPPVAKPLTPPSPELGFPPASNGEGKPSETPTQEKPEDATKPSESDPAKESESKPDTKGDAEKTEPEKTSEPEASTAPAAPKSEGGQKDAPREPADSKPSGEPAEPSK